MEGLLERCRPPNNAVPILGVKPDTGQWKWQESVAAEAVANYQEYLANYADKMTLEEYWESTGRTKRFVRRNPDGTGKNIGVEHWIPASTGILRSSNWTDILASETLAGLGLTFDNPKSVALLRTVAQLCSEEGDIVLDFFAGSCTTAQAVLELNRQDGGNRRFVMVQLPEPTPEGSAAREAGFENIAEIGKERIRRVIARLKEQDQGKLDLPDRETPEDLGFRVYKLAPSNYRSWSGVEVEGDQPPAPEAYVHQMELFTDALADGWTPQGVIAEVALKEAGFGLNYQVETVEGLEQTVYRVTDPDREQVFYLCLGDTVRLEALKPLGLDRDTLFVCRASALDDETAANLALQCRLRVI